MYHVSSSFINNKFIQQLVYISSGHSTHNANCYTTLSSLKMCALGFYLAEMKWWFRSAPQSCEHVVPWCPSLHHIKKMSKYAPWINPNIMWPLFQNTCTFLFCIGIILLKSLPCLGAKLEISELVSPTSWTWKQVIKIPILWNWCLDFNWGF
jgi:hypothetical protein